MSKPYRRFDDPKTERTPVMLSVKEVEAVDDWGFSNRIRTRSEAIRRLIEIGLLSERMKTEGGAGAS